MATVTLVSNDLAQIVLDIDDLTQTITAIRGFNKGKTPITGFFSRMDGTKKISMTVDPSTSVERSTSVPLAQRFAATPKANAEGRYTDIDGGGSS